ncbi:YphA family membrane protein [Bacillus paranthracis]
MEGSTFYFVAWIGWIVVTFFMKKGLYSVEDKRLYIDFYYFVLRYM